MSPEPTTAAPPPVRPAKDESRREPSPFYGELVEALANPVYLKDAGGKFICVNRAWEQFYGIRRENCIGKSVHEVFPKEVADVHAAHDAALLGGSPPRVYELQVRGADGKMRDTLHNKSLFSRPDGTPAGIIGSLIDITERKREEAKLARSRERMQFGLHGSNLTLWDADVPNDEIYFDREWAQMLGFPPEETTMNTRALLDRVHPDDRDRISRAIGAVLKGEKPTYREEHRMATQSGGWKWMESRGMVVARDAAGAPLRMTGTNADITERKQAEASLRDSEAQLRLMVDNVPALIAYLDMERRYRFVNKRYAEFFGHSTESIIGMHGREVIGEQAYQEYVGHFDKVLAGTPVWYQRPVQQKSGATGYIDVSLVPRLGEDGKVIGAYVLSRDVTASVEAEQRIRHMARHDELTDLLNRREFEERLRQVLPGSEARDYALIYLNVDQLKIVNDSCGHAAGDALLRQIATVLLDHTAADDLLARLGSDEFGVLHTVTSADSARVAADSLRQAAQTLRFAWLERSFPVSISIGVVPLTGQNVEELLTMGDAACRIAKNRGRNRIHVYHPTDSELALRRNQIEWRSRILDALEHNRFQLYWQPIAALGGPSQVIEHYEVLLRMLDENGETIAPMAFIPTAEHFGLMPALDRWVVSAALAAYPALSAAGKARGGLTLAINLSGDTLGVESFPAFVRGELERFHVNPRSICFEITETAAISDISRARSFIKEFKNLGCQFSLDDFGSGMSSFGYLRNLPVDYVKIDGSFIRDICRDSIDLAIVESINHIGHILGKQTIAEFVEDDATIELLRKVGVDFAQGYGVDAPKPMPGGPEGGRR